jgi:hypothetical protein
MPNRRHGGSMRLWGALYGAIWVVFVEFLLAMIPQGQPYLLYVHGVLGFLIVALAYSNYRALRGTTAPGRIKRVASASFSLSVFMAFLGPLIFFNVGAGGTILFGLTVWNALLFLHVVTAFGIITQMAAVAIAYDMWEEKEFLRETRPGEVPRAPTGT